VLRTKLWNLFLAHFGHKWIDLCRTKSEMFPVSSVFYVISFLTSYLFNSRLVRGFIFALFLVFVPGRYSSI